MLRWVGVQYCGQRGGYEIEALSETPISLIDQAPTIVINYVDVKVNDNRDEKKLPPPTTIRAAG
jgi:hypothetical protein